MDEVEKKIRIKLRDDFCHYAIKCLKIRPKEGQLSEFKLNKAQLFIHEKVEIQRALTGKVRAIILKGRQQGCSTYVEGRYFWRVTHRVGVRAFILTHHADATNNLFDMSKRFYDYCPDVIKPELTASNSKELMFKGIDSGYKVGTAGTESIGRSSTIQFFHGSEVAMWPHAQEHAKGILQAIPDAPGTEVFLESTANGMGNFFHEQWQLAEAGQSDYIAIFIPWFWQDEYRVECTEDLILDEEEERLVDLYRLDFEQLMFRRRKIVQLSTGGSNGFKSFQQEYPCSAVEAFQISGEDTFIDPNVVMKARKTDYVEKIGPLLIGVDPAWNGASSLDRTSIIRRRGRVVYDLQSYVKKDTMEIVGLVHQIILLEKPEKVFVDVCGIGAGVYDRLKELGFSEMLIPINAGSTALNQRDYANKRAEMWGNMREWLYNEPCQIPDLDSLHADLCGIRSKPNSNSQILLEPKDHMKKRGLRSPDEADALALTFALPVNYYDQKKKEKDNDATKSIIEHFAKIDQIRNRAYCK